MKALLMHRDRDFAPERPLPWNARPLIEDLELDTLLHAMAGDDDVVLDVLRSALLSGVSNDLDTIRYRQDILRDALAHPDVIRGLYDLSVAAVEATRREWWGISGHFPSSMVHSSVNLIERSMDRFGALRKIAEEEDSRFTSDGFRAFFSTIREELSDEYLASVRDHLNELKFRRGVLLSAELGRDNEGARYALRRSSERGAGWFKRLLGKGPESYTFYIAERDMAGAEILSAMRHRGISRVAVALAESADHVLSFFRMLRTELAFYVGCLNLHGRLTSREEPVCFPTAVPAGERRLRFRGLYDVCLSLRLEGRAVGNAADADGKSLVVVTGANQGGKSTFLRSIGLAQAMMQSGMFVGAEAFTGELCSALCTHYKREEDATMKSGKLDEELARMSQIVDHSAPGSMLLFNESFAATNEHEGSAIATQIVSALLEKRIKVFYVTHLYEFAHGFADRNGTRCLFLRAERRVDGARTFRVIEGEPLETSYGDDLYKEVFGLEAGEGDAAGGSQG